MKMSLPLIQTLYLHLQSIYPDCPWNLCFGKASVNTYNPSGKINPDTRGDTRYLQHDASDLFYPANHIFPGQWIFKDLQFISTPQQLIYPGSWWNFCCCIASIKTFNPYRETNFDTHGDTRYLRQRVHDSFYPLIHIYPMWWMSMVRQGVPIPQLPIHSGCTLIFHYNNA